MRKVRESQHLQSITQKMWRDVQRNDKKEVYRNIVSSDIDVNAIRGTALSNACLTLAEVMKLQEQVKTEDKLDDFQVDKVCEESSKPKEECMCTEGNHEDFSLLHLASQSADIGMVELLLQYGANINASDSAGQTPLHHCIIRGRSAIAKILLKR